MTLGELLQRVTSISGVAESFRFATPANPYTLLCRFDTSVAPPDPRVTPQRHIFDVLWAAGFRATSASNMTVPRKGLPSLSLHSGPIPEPATRHSTPVAHSVPPSNSPPTPEQLATCNFLVDGATSFLEVKQSAAIFGTVEQISLIPDLQKDFWRSMRVRYSAKESAFLAHGRRVGGVRICANYPNERATSALLEALPGDFSTEWGRVLAAGRTLGATRACLDATNSLALPGDCDPPGGGRKKAGTGHDPPPKKQTLPPPPPPPGYYAGQTGSSTSSPKLGRVHPRCTSGPALW